MEIIFTSTTKSGLSQYDMQMWLAVEFAEQGIWDLNDVYAWQVSQGIV
jgi:hypothetical protein